MVNTRKSNRVLNIYERRGGPKARIGVITNLGTINRVDRPNNVQWNIPGAHVADL
jgi:hypothetical protein